MNGVFKMSKIRWAAIIILFSSLIQILAINSNYTKSENKYIIDLEYNENEIYSGNLWLGSNLQKLNLIFSTSSELSLIANDECKDCIAGNKNTKSYDSKKSDNFKNLSETLKIHVKNYFIKISKFIFLECLRRYICKRLT
jgi:hypothetical protein